MILAACNDSDCFGGEIPEIFADLDLISGLRLVFDDPAVKRRNARTHKTLKNMGS